MCCGAAAAAAAEGGSIEFTVNCARGSRRRCSRAAAAAARSPARKSGTFSFFWAVPSARPPPIYTRDRVKVRDEWMQWPAFLYTCRFISSITFFFIGSVIFDTAGDSWKFSREAAADILADKGET